ncbi:MAG: alanine--tRNA ligase [Alphaproteobacteria bacterium]|nr:MAG: alanine--tRNA ligase [Alphaproteobacteria bacterium]
MTIRNKFLNYFRSHDHLILPSYSLIPQNDPSLLFINSGMAPMKRFFTRELTPPSNKIADVQKCLRAGGKHNDLDEVGFTPRHHTFFEMLGNFSFGDYFKEKAIHMAWDFLTNCLSLPADRLFITIHPDDTETEAIWKSIPNLDKNHIVLEKSNSWSAGTEGPQGLCTEIFYDYGPHINGTIQEGNRFVEIWNLVFMTDNLKNGVLHKLENKCVDTGMGLERIEAVCSGVTDNYDAPFFKNMISMIHDKNDFRSNRIIADHSRAITFLIDDGVFPSSDGAGYVLRKIMRRAIRRSINNDSIETCINYVITNMANNYPSLLQNKTQILETFLQEKKQFTEIYNSGIAKLDYYIQTGQIDEQRVVELYDTYGFPYDIALEILKEKNISLDSNKIQNILDKQKEVSQSQKYDIPFLDKKSEFVGYEHNEINTQILHYDKKHDLEFILLEKTPFYVEAGGQKSDTGFINGPYGSFQVYDLQKHKNEIWHIGKTVRGKLQNGESVVASIDVDRRKGMKQHHTATHILLSVLRKKFGNSVLQKGSSVKESGLRLDFSLNHLIDKAQLNEIILEINGIIQDNLAVKTSNTTYENAIDLGALITEKSYPEEVRVVEINNISTELCCGTHVSYTGEIGLFLIKNHKSISAGIKRIEAICGMEAVKSTIENNQSVQKEAKQIEVNKLEESIFIHQNIKVIIQKYKNANQQYLLTQSDMHIKQHNLVILLSEKSILIKSNNNKLVLKDLFIKLGAKGGGKPNVIQGTMDPRTIEDITLQIKEFLSND